MLDYRDGARASGKRLPPHFDRLALPATAHVVYVDQDRYPSAVGIHGLLNFGRLFVYASPDIPVVRWLPASVNLVHDPIGAVAIQKCCAGITGQALEERGVWIPDPDRELIR
jgi:hypothetical protein